MVLADTSVWVDHLRRGNPHLAAQLEQEGVLTHPFVIGELACGGIRNRKEILTLLKALPAVGMVPHADAIGLLESFGLFDRGLGWIDIHLLAATRSNGYSLWTLDKTLKAAAGELGVEASF